VPNIKDKAFVKKIHVKTILCLLIILLTFLSGCSKPLKHRSKDGPPKHIPPNLLKTPDAIPKIEPLSRYGNRFKKSNTYVALRKRYRVLPTSRGYRAKGLASWYGTQFHGRKTSSGERYNMFEMTAAHPTLPLPTYARVTNLDNGKSVVVKINDRGPFHDNRLIDVSYVAAAKLGMLGPGTGRVEVVSIDPRDHGGKIPKLHSVPIHIATADKKPVSAVVLIKTPTKKQNIYLHLGTYHYRAKAEALVKKIEKLSKLPSHITQKDNRGSTLFQIRIGPIHNSQEAINLTQKLARARLPIPVVIKEHP
jgi:rare lipoprotein A